MRKRKERKRKMYIVLGCILVLIGFMVIWFHIPFSSTKKEFERDVEVLMNHAKDNKGEVFTEEDFKEFPIPIQRYIEASGIFLI